MTEKDIADGWKQANIARVLCEMERYGLVIADLLEADTIQAMSNIAGTQTPHQPSGNTVADQ